MSDQLDFDFTGDPATGSGDGNSPRPESTTPERSAPVEKQRHLFECDSAANAGAAAENGFNQWRASNLERLTNFANRLGLPLGHPVELTLHNGTVLRGRLQLAAASSKTVSQQFSTKNLRPQLSLNIGRADFSASDVASCVRLNH